MHRHDEHTFFLRQSKTVSYEAPFLYLLFGNDRALLLDTGATHDPARCPLRETVDDLITRWLSRHARTAYGLVVAHTHGHGDHIAGDAQFVDRPLTTMVGRDLSSVIRFFGFATWPEQVVPLDLGGRVLEITGSPCFLAFAVAPLSGGVKQTRRAGKAAANSCPVHRRP